MDDYFDYLPLLLFLQIESLAVLESDQIVVGEDNSVQYCLFDIGGNIELLGQLQHLVFDLRLFENHWLVEIVLLSFSVGFLAEVWVPPWIHGHAVPPWLLLDQFRGQFDWFDVQFGRDRLIAL